MKPANVIVIGGGIGGLTTALALRREGIKVSVYERATRLAEVGAGITLWPNAMRALLDLGPGDAIVRRGRRFDTAQIRNIKGQILSRTSPAAVEERLNAPALAIHRAELHAALVDAIPGEILHLGAECAGIEQRGDDVEVRFSNGKSVAGDLVIGADGINSTVRRMLFPDIALRYSGYTGWRGDRPGRCRRNDRNLGTRGPLRDRSAGRRSCLLVWDAQQEPLRGHETRPSR